MKKIIFSLFIFLSIIASASETSENIFHKQYTSDIVYGSKDAKIEVFEFYSLSCHHCSHFYFSSFPNLKKDYIDTGKVKWVKRSYALDMPSVKATMLLECVPEDRKESYVKILLNKQSSWAYQKSYLNILKNIATLGGMNPDNFDRCVNDQNLEQSMKTRTDLARTNFNINGTPTFFVNGKQEKIFSESSFRELLDKLTSLK